MKRSWADLEPLARCALRLGAYQCAFLDRVPPHAAVDATVEATKRRRPALAGLVNGVLRAWLRDGAPLPPADELASRCVLPDWWAERWRQRGAPEAWLAATLEHLPVVVRPHRRVVDDATLFEELRGDGVRLVASPHVPGAWRVAAGEVIRSAASRRGALSLRGEASQLVASLVGARRGELVLDACAGRGGKALQIAEEADGARLLAVDRALWRVRQCRDAATRAVIPELRVLVADLTHPLPVSVRFDRILVDAPCSGLGTVRSRPEIKWRIGPQRLAPLAALQRRILRNAAGSLAVGGTLLYVTCSTEPEENEEVVVAVAEELDGLEIVPVRLPESLDPALVGGDGYLRTWTAVADLEGFFAARLRRLG